MAFWVQKPEGQGSDGSLCSHRDLGCFRRGKGWAMECGWQSRAQVSIFPHSHTPLAAAGREGVWEAARACCWGPWTLNCGGVRVNPSPSSQCGARQQAPRRPWPFLVNPPVSLSCCVPATNLGRLWPLHPTLTGSWSLGGCRVGDCFKDFLGCCRSVDQGPEARAMVPVGPSNCSVTLGKSLYLSGLQIPRCQMKELDWSMIQ